MTGWILNNLWATGGIVVALLFILHRLVSNEKLDQWGFSIGKTISSLGRNKLGKDNWERIENATENWIGALAKGFLRGLSFDDTNGNNTNGSTGKN